MSQSYYSQEYPNVQNSQQGEFFNNEVYFHSQIVPRSTLGRMPLRQTAITNNPNAKILQEEIDELNEKLENLIQEYQEKLSKQKTSLTVDINGLKDSIQNLEQENEDKNQINKLQKYEIQTLKQKIVNLKDEKSKILEEKEQLEDDNKELNQRISLFLRSTTNNSSNLKEIEMLKEQHQKEIQKLRDDHKKQKDELISQKQKLEQDLDQLQIEYEKQIKQVDKEHQYFIEARDEITKLQKIINQKDDKIRQLDQQQMAQMDALKSANIEQQRLKDCIRQKEFDINCLQDGIKILKDIIEQQKLMLHNNSYTSQGSSDLENKLKELEQLSNQLNQKQQQENLRLQKDIEEKEQNRLRQLEILKQKQEDARNNYIKKKQNLVAKGGQIMQEAKKQQGQLDVCFIVDVTGSMDSYKIQTKNSVKGSLQIIKQATNRDTNWASVCYQDKAELKQLGKYHEFPFDKNSEALQKWFDTIACTGGGDGPEDIRGAIKQVCQLNWPSKFKIAILICDAPCHGKRYNNGGDDYPDDDIEDAIEELIRNNIILIALNFTAYTTKMYDEIKKIYESKKKQDLFLYQDLQKMDQAQMANLMIKYIGQASQNATQTNKNQTKSKQGAIQQEIIREKEGAMEALCKQGNFYDFEKQPNVKTVPTKFTVLRVEIKQEAFDKNIENIEFIQCPQDFISIQEGQWNCIRTEKPFAFGMMKDVFLMKKLDGNSEELYVIKTPIGSKPYETLNDALKECKSHLICQKLMKKFVNELQEQKVQKQQNIRIPSVIYSDFLILQESQNSFWIAERFFKGEFVKYNNNYGFINEENSDLNKFAQSFTFYTYLISDFHYMVTDVQGVGNYFTDPAINTIQGYLDDTDMGLEGQQMYMVNYEIKKTILTYDYLGLLDLYQ